MLSDQITRLRKSAGMNQLQLGERLNISPSAVGMYEQGRRTPSLETLVRLSVLFGVSLDYLITGQDSGAKRNAPQAACPCGHLCAHINPMPRTHEHATHRSVVPVSIVRKRHNNKKK